jgi:MFS transporter, BCD family, chlorophyll transporter
MSRLLRLSLFKFTMGITTALMIGTFNRVMIVELGVSAWLVAMMLALPFVGGAVQGGYRLSVRCACVGIWLAQSALHVGWHLDSVLGIGGHALCAVGVVRSWPSACP